MPWFLFLLALATLAVAIKTTSMALLMLCLVVGFVLTLAGVLKLFARRVDSRSRDEALMLDPEELRRLREQVEARKLAAAAEAEPPQT